VRLRQDVRLPSHQLDFRRSGRGWELVIDRPPLTRMEHLLELRHGDGSTELATDPGNPLRVLRPATHPAARPDAAMNRVSAGLSSDAIGAAGTVIRYGLGAGGPRVPQLAHHMPRFC